jgi:hypothetical protein
MLELSHSEQKIAIRLRLCKVGKNAVIVNLKRLPRQGTQFLPAAIAAAFSYSSTA